MIIENKKIEKICNFYVSEFHLEMILLPYITKKIEQKEPISIISEKNLEKSINELISKVNLKEHIKNTILKLKWNNEEEINIEDNSNIILIGTEKFITNRVEEIIKMNYENIKIIDCYNLEEVENNVQNIVIKHDKTLNTLGITEI